MLTLSSPLWLLALSALPLLWWLHRFHELDRAQPVAALFLWPVRDAPGGRLRPSQRTDPLWLLRALTCCLLVLALCGPQWRSSERGALHIWVDDSPSMYALEGGTSRMEQALSALERQLAASQFSAITAHSLAAPGESLALQSLAPGARGDALRAWLHKPRGEPQPPAAAMMGPGGTHWLLSDGASEGIAPWAQQAPLARRFTAGGAAGNVGITRLSLRRESAARDTTRLLVTVANGGRETALRELRVTAGARPVAALPLRIAAGGQVDEVIDLPAVSGAALRAAISPADALPLDDSLQLPAAALQPVTVAVADGCGPHLRAALAAHPGLALTDSTGEPAGLNVYCGGAGAGQAGPALRTGRQQQHSPLTGPLIWLPAAGALRDLSLDPGWLSASQVDPPGKDALVLLRSADRPLLLFDGKRKIIDSGLDLAAPGLVNRPEYPLLISGLVDLLLADTAGSGAVVSVANPSPVSIAPRPLPPGPQPGSAGPDPGRRDITSAMIAAALLTLLLDPAWRGPRRSLVRVGGRLLVLGCLLLALLPPPLPFTRAPLEVIALVDESLSMPPDYAGRAWQQLRALLADAPAKTRLQLIRFAANPVLESVAGPDSNTPATAGLPRSKPLDRGATDIAGALDQALHLVPPDGQTVMVLVTDAAATHGDTERALRAVRRAGVPLYLLAPQVGNRGEPPQLRDLQVPAQVNAGDEVPVVALVTGAAGGAVSAILQIDGRVEERQSLKPVPGEPALALFRFVAGTPGVSLVTVGLAGDLASGRDGTIAGQTRAVNVLGPAPLLYVSQRPGPNPITDNLQLAGWEVATLTPGGLTAHLSQLQQAGVIIVDNLAIDDLSEAAWQALAKSVRVDGKGLAVLGGPRSFGAGAYRHSTLEQILPVTAEAAEPQEPAAVIFLLDRSGSMGRERAGPSRLSLARQAVAVSVDMLLPDDYLGIIAFAAEAEIRLPLGTRQAGGDEVAAALEVTPAGGTRLAPALQLAAQQLREVDAGQRLIVLVTDGFTADEDLQAISRDLQSAGITVIALAVGEDPNRETLQLLTGFNGGRVLPVSDVVTLPRLMAGAVAARRAPAVAEATVPAAVQALPFPLDPVSQWPPLSAYMVSKARPAAQVYLQSSGGDPLFASGRAGAGRVAVLPAGLGSWASSWWPRPWFGPFLGGLMHWLDPGYGADGLSLAITDRPGELLLSLDLQTDGMWDSGARPRLLVDDPAGSRSELVAELEAPGRYRATLPAMQPGLYLATLQAAGRTLRQGFYRNGNRETETAVAPISRQHWLEQGWLKPWPGVDELLATGPRDVSGLRRVLLALALLSYLLLLMSERGLAHALAHRLRSQFSR